MGLSRILRKIGKTAIKAGVGYVTGGVGGAIGNVLARGGSGAMPGGHIIDAQPAGFQFGQGGLLQGMNAPGAKLIGGPRWTGSYGVAGGPRRHRRGRGITGSELRGFHRVCSLLRREGMQPRRVHCRPRRRR